MKSLHILAILATLGSSVFAQQAEQVGTRNIAMRPTEKRALALNPSERNPYAKRSIVPEDKKETENAEEIALRKKLNELKVSGASLSHHNATLLLGDIVVREGMVLPQLLTNQTQFIKVVDIAETKIVLEWLDPETGALTNKKIRIPYDLTPSVKYVLQGQPEGGTELGAFRPQR